MIEHYFDTNFSSARTLQEQIREKLIKTIMSGCFPENEPMPSSRKLAKTLSVSRNTIICIYDSLIEDGFLVSKNRQGYFVSPQVQYDEMLGDLKEANDSEPHVSDGVSNLHLVESSRENDGADWNRRFKKVPSIQANIVKPKNWARYKYPFIYGQVQQNSFPIQHWRNSVRTMLANAAVGDWIHDNVDQDDPAIIEQLRKRILPRRGIYASPQEILMTMGTQNSLFLIAKLLIDAKTKIAVENPGFRDAFNIFKAFDGKVSLHKVDDEGLEINSSLDDSDYIFTTPGHQVPTGAVMSVQRRKELMSKIYQRDIVVLEDDYDSDINLNDEPLPALKADDPGGRVIYMGSLSKLVAPGLRMGYIVADPELIKELRSLRRLIYRHPPTNNQRTAAHFIAQGFYDTHLRKMRDVNREKREIMSSALSSILPGSVVSPSIEAQSSFWLRLDKEKNSDLLRKEAEKNSILVEPGNIHFLGASEPDHFFRLGFSAISKDKIEAGIRSLNSVIQSL